MVVVRVARIEMMRGDWAVAALPVEADDGRRVTRTSGATADRWTELSEGVRLGSLWMDKSKFDKNIFEQIQQKKSGDTRV